MPHVGKKWSGRLKEVEAVLPREKVAEAIGGFLVGEEGVSGAAMGVPCHGGVADVLGVNVPSGLVTFVTVKRSMIEFMEDQSVWSSWAGYLGGANRAYIACEKGVIHSLEVPDPYGLLYVDPKTMRVTIEKPALKLAPPDQKSASLNALREILGALSRREFLS